VRHIEHECDIAKCCWSRAVVIGKAREGGRGRARKGHEEEGQRVGERRKGGGDGGSRIDIYVHECII